MADAPFAEDLNYWKTSRTEFDSWLDKAEQIIEGFGGEVTRRATAREFGREAMLLEFTFGDDTFRAVWPVLESRDGDRRSARRQAATMLFHDVKSRSVRVAIYGARLAFLDMFLTQDGTPVAGYFQRGMEERLPKLLRAAADE